MAVNGAGNAPATDASGLLLGRNGRGDWVVCDRAGRRGGLFISLSDAQRYVRLQAIGRTDSNVTMAGSLELDLSAA